MATNRMINPNELMSEIDKLYYEHYAMAYDQAIHDFYNAVCRRIRRCTSVDSVEVVHGRWVMPTIINGRSFKIPHCSVCNEVPCGVSENTKYCAICGARMDLENTKNG